MLEFYFLIGTILLLIAVIAYLQITFIKTERMHKEEREGLYNRIMAKDLNEYSMAQSPLPKRTSGGSMIRDVEDLKNQGYIK